MKRGANKNYGMDEPNDISDEEGNIVSSHLQ